MSKDDGKRIENYGDSYRFTASSRVRRDGDVIWIPELYCHNGHSLMDTGVTFDGYPSVHILVRTGDEVMGDVDFYLSSIVNDQRKQGPELPRGVPYAIACPTCGEEFKRLIPCTCQVGAYRRAIYLTPDPGELAAVGICECYDCPRSFVTEEGDLLYEVVVEQTKPRG
ncbi:MAG: hypothetical protein JXR83_21990 [Deltaproteobacteria bacterium]|nr:hypothetical protein [Deltaproteobacteria bacterium]